MNQKGDFGLTLIVILALLALVGYFLGVRVVVNDIDLKIAEKRMEAAETKLPRTGGSANIKDCVPLSIKEDCPYLAHSTLDYSGINEVIYEKGYEPKSDADKDRYETLFFKLDGQGLYDKVKAYCKDGKTMKDFSWCQMNAFILSEGQSQPIKLCIRGKQAFVITVTRNKGGFLGRDGFGVHLEPDSTNFKGFTSADITVEDSDRPANAPGVLDKALLVLNSDKGYASIDAAPSSNPRSYFFVLGSYRIGSYPAPDISGKSLTFAEYYTITPTFFFSRDVADQLMNGSDLGNDCGPASGTASGDGKGSTAYNAGSGAVEVLTDLKDGVEDKLREKSPWFDKSFPKQTPTPVSVSPTGNPAQTPTPAPGKFNVAVHFSPWNPQAGTLVKAVYKAKLGDTGTAVGNLSCIPEGDTHWYDTVISGGSDAAKYVAQKLKALKNMLPGSGTAATPTPTPTSTPVNANEVPEGGVCTITLDNISAGAYTISYDADGEAGKAFAPDMFEIPAAGTFDKVWLFSLPYENVYANVKLSFSPEFVANYDGMFSFTAKGGTKLKKITPAAGSSTYRVGGTADFDKTATEVTLNLNFADTIKAKTGDDKIKLDDALFMYYWNETQSKDIPFLPLFNLKAAQRDKLAENLKTPPQSKTVFNMLHYLCEVKLGGGLKDTKEKFRENAKSISESLNDVFWDYTNGKCKEINGVAPETYQKFSFPKEINISDFEPYVEGATS